MIILNNGDNVEYDDSYYGKGKGVICGRREIDGKQYYVVYPKVMVHKEDYLAYIIPKENLMEIPF